MASVCSSYGLRCFMVKMSPPSCFSIAAGNGLGEPEVYSHLTKQRSDRGVLDRPSNWAIHILSLMVRRKVAEYPLRLGPSEDSWASFETEDMSACPLGIISGQAVAWTQESAISIQIPLFQNARHTWHCISAFQRQDFGTPYRVLLSGVAAP